MLKRIALIGINAGLIFTSIACSHSTTNQVKKPEINPEIFGQWKSDDNCQLILEKTADGVILVNFASKARQLQNLPLIAYKESIMTRFRAESEGVFRASFLEGVIMVDGYCKQPLHKIDNY